MGLKKRHLRNIINANNENRLAIFIGAGVSKSSDTELRKLPTWNDLIEDFKNDLELKNESDNLKIAQLYYLEFSEHSYYNKVKSYFPEDVKSSVIHKQIFELNPQIIITTNWDCILESSIEENAYIYDVVRCDEDLVKSTLQKKLIKMHGDFKNHNIVFKEDDYLNYSYNFPLIENYIKSILSTHTVLFLGYSYNDINLKQISKWIQNNSKVQPPRYLTVFKENMTQTKYLKNYGINSIVLDKPNVSLNSNLSYTENISYFLNLLKNYNQMLIISENDILDFVLNKLSMLNNLESILLEQIQKVLTNCRFIYDEEKTILEFCNNILTYDFDENIRNIYSKFIDILIRFDANEIQNTKIYDIFKILARANIQGIIISKNDTQVEPKKYIVLQQYLDNIKTELDSDYINFQYSNKLQITNDLSSLLDCSFLAYQKGDYKKSYELTEKTISICLKQRNYSQLFIAFYNKNILIDLINFTSSEIINSLKRFKKQNIELKFNELPKDSQVALKPILDFLNSCYMYRYAFNISTDLRKTEKSKRIIESGGIVYDTDISRYSIKHFNLIQFIYSNKIMIENTTQYKVIMKYFVEIAIIRQIQKKEIHLNKTELYSAIKYIERKDLMILLGDFYRVDSQRKGNFSISSENKKWLIDIVLNNLCKSFIESKKVTDNISNYFENLIFLLSLTKLSNEELENILLIIKDVFGKARNTFGIYESINLFFGIQYNLFNTQIDKTLLLKLIKTILFKFVNKQYNGFDFHAMRTNAMYYLYDYSKAMNVIFDDLELIEKLIFELKSLNINDQVSISQALLLNLYDISTEEIGLIIKKYVLSINNDKSLQKDDLLEFKLILLIHDFTELTDDVENNLNTLIDYYENSNSFSSRLYRIESQLSYLISNKNLSNLEKYSIRLKIVIKSFEEKKRKSIF